MSNLDGPIILTSALAVTQNPINGCHIWSLIGHFKALSTGQSSGSLITNPIWLWNTVVQTLLFAQCNEFITNFWSLIIYKPHPFHLLSHFPENRHSPIKITFPSHFHLSCVIAFFSCVIFMNHALSGLSMGSWNECGHRGIRACRVPPPRRLTSLPWWGALLGQGRPVIFPCLGAPQRTVTWPTRQGHYPPPHTGGTGWPGSGSGHPRRTGPVMNPIGTRRPSWEHAALLLSLSLWDDDPRLKRSDHMDKQRRPEAGDLSDEGLQTRPLEVYNDILTTAVHYCQNSGRGSTKEAALFTVFTFTPTRLNKNWSAVNRSLSADRSWELDGAERGCGGGGGGRRGSAEPSAIEMWRVSESAPTDLPLMFQLHRWWARIPAGQLGYPDGASAMSALSVQNWVPEKTPVSSGCLCVMGGCVLQRRKYGAFTLPSSCSTSVYLLVVLLCHVLVGTYEISVTALCTFMLFSINVWGPFGKCCFYGLRTNIICAKKGSTIRNDCFLHHSPNVVV